MLIELTLSTKAPREWQKECTEASKELVAEGDLWKLQRRQVQLMSAAASYAATICAPPFPTGVDVHWETEHRVVWNEQQHVSEERGLVYEVSWVAELGILRRFLRSNRKVQS